MDEQYLKDKVALITGSSRGIGRAIALELARVGADVVVNYARKKSAAEAVVDRVKTLGRKAIAIKANLADPDKVDTMLKQIEVAFGRCDIFIGNAASGIPRPILEVTEKHWDWTMDINARSIWRCVKWAVPFMEKAGWGRIINISSQGSTKAIPNYGVTGLSKAAVESLTRYLAVDLAPKGIIANVISPGIVLTDALAHFPIDVQQTITEVTERTPTGRIVTPEEVGQLVAFLCSDGAKMIVGQTIVVDGGLSLRF